MAGREPSKVVVRLLPPEITEAELLATVDDKHKQNAKWVSFVAGKRYKGEAKPCLNARCYLHFESPEQSEEFVRDYHGHQFVDGQGETFRAVACMAPYQKVPRAKPQKDPRDGTIVDDPLFKEFVEGLGTQAAFEAPPDPRQDIRPADLGDTPLLQFMKTRAKERRAKAEKRRREREKWRPEGGYIEEDPKGKKPRWRCKECGTSANLEEDPDDRGVFYCTPCWEYWETEEASSKPKKKKKKKGKKEEEEWAEEEEVEEEEATSSKKKKKKKKHEKDDNWWEQKPSATEWTEEEESGSKKKKKKKKKEGEEEEEWREEGESHSTGRRWKAKKAQAEEWQEDTTSKPKSKKKKDDEWWEENPQEENASKSSSGRRRRNKGEDRGGGGGGRWVAKS